jgi:hypothetical protein
MHVTNPLHFEEEDTFSVKRIFAFFNYFDMDKENRNSLRWSFNCHLQNEGCSMDEDDIKVKFCPLNIGKNECVTFLLLDVDSKLLVKITKKLEVLMQELPVLSKNIKKNYGSDFGGKKFFYQDEHPFDPINKHGSFCFMVEVTDKLLEACGSPFKVNYTDLPTKGNFPSRPALIKNPALVTGTKSYADVGQAEKPVAKPAAEAAVKPAKIVQVTRAMDQLTITASKASMDEPKIQVKRFNKKTINQHSIMTDGEITLISECVFILEGATFLLIDRKPFPLGEEDAFYTVG